MSIYRPSSNSLCSRSKIFFLRMAILQDDSIFFSFIFTSKTTKAYNQFNFEVFNEWVTFVFINISTSIHIDIFILLQVQEWLHSHDDEAFRLCKWTLDTDQNRKNAISCGEDRKRFLKAKWKQVDWIPTNIDWLESCWQVHRNSLVFRSELLNRCRIFFQLIPSRKESCFSCACNGSGFPFLIFQGKNTFNNESKSFAENRFDCKWLAHTTKWMQIIPGIVSMCAARNFTNYLLIPPFTCIQL